MAVDVRQLPGAIQWHEGMLLAPQHFQQLSLRMESLLHYHSMVISPFNWGVRLLSYDKVLLVSGTFRVLELEGLMPDGLLVSHNTDSDDELQIDLSPYVEQMREGPVTIHIAVAARRAGGHGMNDDIARFESIETEAVDEYTGDGGVTIPRLKPKLTLIVANTPPSKYISFPLARIGFRDQMYAITDYLAPTLSVPRSSPLGDICSQIARQLREKALYLSDEIRTRFYILGPSGVLDNKGKIQSLVESLPLLEGILNTSVSHPYMLYTTLCLVAGHVSALGRSLVPPMLAPYDHNDLQTSFGALRDYIFTTIDEGIWESHFSIAFYYQNEAFNLQFEEAWLNSPLLIGVRGSADTSEKDVRNWIDEALISSESRIQSLRERRILGVQRQRYEEDDLYVAARGLLLFRLESDRENIHPGELLQILNPTDPGTTISEIILFVQKDRKA